MATGAREVEGTSVQFMVGEGRTLRRLTLPRPITDCDTPSGGGTPSLQERTTDPPWGAEYLLVC